jgi:hypothetical protein
VIPLPVIPKVARDPIARDPITGIPYEEAPAACAAPACPRWRADGAVKGWGIVGQGQWRHLHVLDGGLVGKRGRLQQRERRRVPDPHRLVRRRSRHPPADPAPRPPRRAVSRSRPTRAQGAEVMLELKEQR